MDGTAADGSPVVRSAEVVVTARQMSTAAAPSETLAFAGQVDPLAAVLGSLLVVAGAAMLRVRRHTGTRP